MTGTEDRERAPGRRLLFAAACGFVFGFLLQKGGVAKHHVLVGSLLLQDFTVFKVMLSAIATGMAGVFVLRWFGLVELDVAPLRWLANVVGGLVFGVGFALAGYCPGTQAAAIGQGNFDAIVGAAGMVAGSWVYALASERLQSIEKVGNRGERTLADALHVRRTWFVAGAVPLLIGILLALDAVGQR